MTEGEAFSSISGSGDDFGQVVALCESLGEYCLIGGLAVNAYVEPVYTMDAGFVLAATQLPQAHAALLRSGFTLEEHPHSLNAIRPGSQLRIQFTRDPRYHSFPERAERRAVLGRWLESPRCPIFFRASFGRGATQTAASASARRTSWT